MWKKFKDKRFKLSICLFHRFNILLSVFLFAMIPLLLLSSCSEHKKEAVPSPTPKTVVAIPKPTPTPDPNALKVKIQTSEIEYYHLGDDISYRYSYNGESIHNGDIIALTDEDVTIDVVITESDTHPDTGYGSVTVSPSQYIETSNSETIAVYESGGRRYPDAYAVYEVTVKLEPVVS